jgi:adenylylsulfate kinase-like enzyme
VSLFGINDQLRLPSGGENIAQQQAETCAERDPKGLYQKAATGELPNLTGVGQEYEAPESADIVLDGTRPIAENIEALLAEFFN